MAQSKLNDSILYTEETFIDKDDIDYESSIYNGTLYKKSIKFLLGKLKTTFRDDYDILYVNIYLINNRDLIRIGVYEFNSDEYTSKISSNGDIKITDSNKSLLFSFVKNYITNPAIFNENQYEFNDLDEFDKVNEVDESEVELDDDINDEEDEKTFTEDEKTIIEPVDAIDKIEESEEKYTIQDTSIDPNVWINNYMLNNKYSIIKTSGDGDCFFSVLKMALEKTDKYKAKDDLTKPDAQIITVKRIREKLAENVTEQVFKTYKERLNIITQSINDSTLQGGKLKKELKALQVRSNLSNNVLDKTALVELSREKFEMYGGVKNQSTNSLKLYDELGLDVLKDIKSVDDLKEVVKKSTYWADEWSIPALERIYNVKIVIFGKYLLDSLNVSKKEREAINYKNSDHNIIVCGSTNVELEELFKKYIEKKSDGKPFIPDCYIFASYNGSHYDLISYDKNDPKYFFKFKELPQNIKDLIINNCLDKCAGPFSLIPDFRDEAKCQNIDPKDFDDTIDKLVDTKEPEPTIENLKQCNYTGLEKLATTDYDTKNRIYIFNKTNYSDYSSIVGSVKDEQLTLEMSIVNELDKYPHWRDKLSDYYPFEFSVDGTKYTNIQDYLDKKNIKRASKEYLNILCKKFDPNSEINKTQYFADILMKTKNVTIFSDNGNKGPKPKARELMIVRKKLLKP